MHTYATMVSHQRQNSSILLVEILSLRLDIQTIRVVLMDQSDCSNATIISMVCVLRAKVVLTGSMTVHPQHGIQKELKKKKNASMNYENPGNLASKAKKFQFPIWNKPTNKQHVQHN